MSDLTAIVVVVIVLCVTLVIVVAMLASSSFRLRVGSSLGHSKLVADTSVQPADLDASPK